MTDMRLAVGRPQTAPDQWRPSTHFSARDTWLNDPNGLVHHDGTYHLFFQNNPHGNVWGNISWGHATSTDLVTWTEHAVAIESTEDEMVFSGSAVVDHRNTAGFARPGETALVAVYTSATTQRDGSMRQAQALAFSVDDGATWARYSGNPVLDIGSSEFRDPKVFWYGGEAGHWVMVVVEATDHRVAVYTSADLKTWLKASSFGPAHATGGVWECPDLFPLRVDATGDTRWVLIVSLNPGSIAGGSGTQYFVGDFDGRRFTAERLSASEDLADYDWLDYGRDYYAAVSFSNAPDGRRLMVGWASNWEYAADTPTYPWRSSMSLVRELGLVRSGRDGHRLKQRPVLPPDARRHRTGDGPAALPGVLVFTASAPRTGPGSSTFVLDGGADTGEELRITVDAAAGQVLCDRTRAGDTSFHPRYASVDRAPLPDVDGDVQLEIVVDASVVEVYVDGGLVTFTELVFPSTPYDRLSKVV